MKDFLDKLKGAFVESEPGDVVATAPVSTPPAPQPGAKASPSGPWPPVTKSTWQNPALNAAMVAAIRKVTFSRNTALTALITAADGLTDIIPDPVMRLKAAHKTAGGGRSAKEMADAVSIHLNDVDGEEMRFSQALNAKIQSEVGSLITKATTAENMTSTCAEEIKTLQSRIGTLQETINNNSNEAANLRQEAARREAELRQSETEFKAAAASVRDELNGHKATILSTLG